MAVLNECIDLETDAGIRFKPQFKKFSLKCNLEVKMFKFGVPYFCSKYLVPVEIYDFKFVPCPLKLLIKLGRNDLKNFDHVEKFRISLIDLTKDYSDCQTQSMTELYIPIFLT